MVTNNCRVPFKPNLRVSSTRVFRLVLWLNNGRPIQKTCLQGQIETFSPVYIDPESHDAQRYRRTDRQTDGRTDDMIMPVAGHTGC